MEEQGGEWKYNGRGSIVDMELLTCLLLLMYGSANN
jgi:hypothetical protein